MIKGVAALAPALSAVVPATNGPAAVAIVGAGPYGLSIAAHLRAAGIAFRIFGRPMGVWRDNMPKGMFLKSEPFATNLYDPQGAFTLKRFCDHHRLPYADTGAPVPLGTFCDYGLHFVRHCVPDLDERLVAHVRRHGDGFAITLEDGVVEHFRRVVLAVGITHFRHAPPALTALFGDRLAHSAAVGDLDRFRGGRALVIGGGASAVDAAVSLARAGGVVHVVARRPTLAFHAPPRRRTLLDRIRAPMSPVGPSWKGELCTRFPGLFHLLPERVRIEATRRFLGPAPCWFTREAFERTVTLHARSAVIGAAAAADGGLDVSIDTAAGRRTITVDHVIAATGYRTDLRRLPFLDGALLRAIREVEHTPVLTPNFETSVRGLHVVGVAAANSFGPALRFACGARFTARRLARAFRRDAASRGSAPAPR